MEAASGCVYGGHCRSGSPQFAAEKQGYGDQFAVEDLLDFSNVEDCFGGGGEEVGLDGVQVSSAGGSVVTAVESSSNCSSGYNPHFSGELGRPGFVDEGLSDDLCATYDELAELEWLSNFVEESFSSEDVQKFQLISGLKSTTTSSSSSDSQSGVSTAQGRSSQDHGLLRPETHVPGKARSKRSRAAAHTSWSSRLLVLPQATSDGSEAAATPTNPRPGSTAKKTPKPTKAGGSEGPAPAADGRKCLHCATNRTPQWRAGPMGPKTLCNACGVRYKSGRLVPEYRPAASPTFVLSEHSNSHRKVVELRHQKELLLQRQQNHTGQFMHPGGVHEAPAGGVGDQFLLHHRVRRPDLSQLA